MTAVREEADTASAPLEGTFALPHLGIIRAEGPDAASFLQGQLTNDFALMRGDEARLAAYCTAKGRMLASFIGVKLGEGDYLLVTPKDNLPASLKRLSMFVLRAKAKLRDATAEFDLRGLAGHAVANARAPAWAVKSEGSALEVALYPAEGTPRSLRIAPSGTASSTANGPDAGLWSWGEVRSGIAWVTAATAEAFVPQMLNYESVGGVNFRKGCYPGQEVVARSQFRGTLKRRAFTAHCEGECKAGDEVFHEADAGQPCGLVAQAACSPSGGWDAIVSLQLSATQGGKLTVRSADGPALTLLPLPYPLLADV